MSYNKSTAFLMPVLNIKFSTLKRYGFQNCYIGDHDYVERMQGIVYEGHLHLLFRYQSPETKYPYKLNSLYIKFEKRLREHELYITDYIVSRGCAIFVFEFPYPDVLQSFIEGKYSEIDKNYVNKYIDSNQDAYKVCNRDREYWENKWGKILDHPYDPELEVTSPPDLSKEIFNYKPENCVL